MSCSLVSLSPIIQKMRGLSPVKCPANSSYCLELTSQFETNSRLAPYGWRISTQSFIPSLCAVLGVVKLCVPLLAKGEPLITVEVPVVGSYQEAVTGFVNIPRSTNRIVETGV